MGQYYTPVLKQENEIKTFNSWDYDNGLKLMEHSYVGNTFVETVIKEMFDIPTRVAWVGDYAELGSVDNPMADEFINGQGINEIKPIAASPMENSVRLLLVNIDKKEYVNMWEYSMKNTYDGWTIHPLPLLTSIGNGKGGGDYRGLNEELCGRWACDEILVTAWLDKEYQYYEDITPIVNFKEGR